MASTGEVCDMSEMEGDRDTELQQSNAHLLG